MDDTQAALSDLCDALAHPDNVLNVATSHAYRSAIAALAASREKACEQAPVYIEGVNVERLQRACTQQGISIEGSREALIAPRAMADAVNSLTQSVVSPATAGAWIGSIPAEESDNEFAAAIEEMDRCPQPSPAPAGEPVAWMTLTDEGDPAMLFFDRAEAVQYCDDGEQPTPLYEAAPAATPSSYPGIPDNSSAAALGSLHAVACRLRLSGVDDDIAASIAQQISDAAAALSAATPSEDARDAARYRWLRSQHEVDDERASDNNYGKSYPPRTMTVFVDDGHDGLDPLPCDPGALDAAIDAAIAAQEKR